LPERGRDLPALEFLEGFQEVLTAVDFRTNLASTLDTAQHDLDLVSG
jgi:hypothetical protein